MVKTLPANAGAAGDVGSIPGSWRSPGGGNNNPLQYSCLGNPAEEPGRLQSMGSQESDITEWLTLSLSFTDLARGLALVNGMWVNVTWAKAFHEFHGLASLVYLPPAMKHTHTDTHITERANTNSHNQYLPQTFYLPGTVLSALVVTTQLITYPSHLMR